MTVLYVITGPPAGGKSSWIRAHATAQDIVIDLDRIALALAGPGAEDHAHGRVLTKVALRVRFAALDEACKYLDTTDVYLIHTMPDPKARTRYRELGARIVVCDPGRDVVMQRIEDMRQPEMRAVATRWYDRYRKGGSRPVTVQASRQW
ncbi:AAA family ATPase [Streptomyces scabiei]|uniref:AAA family ATPase n=1 Tax=Streptomyces scabiei TaxID=1930 RepID=UPI0037B7BC05